MRSVASVEGIRRARASDLDDLCRIWLEIACHHQELHPSFALRTGTEPEVRKLLQALLRDPEAAAFVFETEGRVGGMSCVRVDRAPPILREVERAEITDLGVRRELRRRGWGRALAEAALGWVRERGVERVEVRVAEANDEGQAFWRSLGFRDHVRVLQQSP